MLPPIPKRIPLACVPTELRALDRVSALIGGPRIWLKCDDQTGSLVSGNKIRKLEFLLADAQKQGCDTILTCGGIQSNHCRATAAVCARLGLHCHIVLRGPISLVESTRAYTLRDVTDLNLEGNLLLDYLCDANISILSPRYYAKKLEHELVALSEQYAQQGQRCYVIPTGGSNALGLWGYILAAKELADDFEREKISPQYVVCATGSGGTQGGLSLGFQLLNHVTQVVGVAVCDSVAYFESKIREDIASWQTSFMSTEPALVDSMNLSTIDDYIGPGYSVGYSELFDCIRWLAKVEGVVLDPVYTGKAFYGLMTEIKKGRFDHCTDLVFVHTGGLYGLFPYKDEFASADRLKVPPQGKPT